MGDKSRFPTKFFVQVLVLLVAVGIAAFTALILMGGIGGVAMGVAPEFSFGLVSGIICPDGDLEFESIQRSYHQPGESEPHLECVTAEGTRENVLPQAIVTVLGVSFVGVFIIVFVVIAVPLSIITRLIVRKLQTRNAPQ